jgi:hypothetical protein
MRVGISGFDERAIVQTFRISIDRGAAWLDNNADPLDSLASANVTIAYDVQEWIAGPKPIAQFIVNGLVNGTVRHEELQGQRVKIREKTAVSR